MLDWLFGSGIGTNLGASLVWGAVAGGFGWWLRGHVHQLHAKLDALHASHLVLHAQLDAHAKAQRNIASQVEALHQRVTGDGREPRPTGRPATPNAPRTPR